MIQVVQCPACGSTQASDLIKTQAQMHPSKEQFQFQQCDNCALVFLNPRVAADQLKEYYTAFYLPYRGAGAWGKYAAQVEKSQLQLDQRRANWLGQYHKMTSDTKVLDIGCGKPSFLNEVYKKYACSCTGIDFSDEGWKDESKRYGNLKLHIGEVKDLPENMKADVVTMWHYLEHDYDPLNTLNTLKQHVHDDTTLIVEVPNYNSDSRKKYGSDWAGFHTPRHTFLFSPETIKKLFDRAGWQVQQVNTFGTLDPFVLYWMSEMERKGIDWSQSMESEFYGYVWGLFKFLPKRLFAKQRSLGIMSVVANPKE